MSQPGSPSTLSPQRQPFLYLTAALIAGLLVDRFIDPPRLITTAFLIVSVAGSVTLLRSKQDAASTVVLLVGFGLAGALLSSTERTPAASRLESIYEAKVISPEVPVEL